MIPVRGARGAFEDPGGAQKVRRARVECAAMDPIAPPPAGRVTLVLTDIAGAGALWERDPDAMRAALVVHDALLRETLAASGGYEARAAGSAFVLGWQNAADAVTWCCRFQEALLDAPWPEALLEHAEAAVVAGPVGGEVWRGLRVRMGVHTGRPLAVPDPRTGRTTWRGPAMRRAGRLAGVAQPGQVLVSEATWRDASGSLGNEVEFTDLGPQRFRGLSGVARVIEARPQTLAGRAFPPLRTVAEARTNLLPDVDAVVGRDDDIAALAELLSFGVRLVTVVGPAGVGKSRLVRELARRHLPRWSGEDQGGVWVCDLSEGGGRVDLLQAVGSALGVPLTLGRHPADSVAQIGHALASRGPILLVIDGAEALDSEAIDDLQSWLRLAPTARVLATGRRRIGLDREVVYQLSALALPRDGDLTEAPAVRLLARRLFERGHRGPTAAGPSALALLERASGLPLAIEMLAGQLGVHATGDLESDLAGRLAGPATPEERLQAVFDAAYARLRPWERGALARCSVFRGGFDLDAAEAVLDLTEWAGAPWVGDAVERLRELGLLRVTDVPSAPGTSRYWMHPFVRAAVQVGFAAPDRVSAEQRHAEWYVGWARTWAEEVYRLAGAEALARLDEERLNLLAAATYALTLRPQTAARVDLGLEAALALCPLLSTVGPFDVELRVLDAAIGAAQTTSGVDPRRLSRALRERAEARRLLGMWVEARADIEAGLALAGEASYAQGEAEALSSYGQLLRLLGKPNDALLVLERALDTARRTGMAREEALILGNIGAVHLHLANVEQARTLITDAMEKFRELGDRRNEGVQVGNLGVVHRRLGNLDRTRELYWEALEIHRETGDRRREGVMLGNLGVLHYHLGDLGTAFDLYDQALSLAREVGDRRSEATALANIGLVYTEQSSYDDALGLFHQALAINRDVGDRTGEGCDAGFLGAVHHLQGDLDKARDHYRRSLELLDATIERRYAGSFLSWAAACEADLGDVAGAEEMFTRAEGHLATAGDPHLLAARTVLVGAVDLAKARQQVERGDHLGAARAREAARERMKRVEREVEAAGEPRSGDLRLATKWLSERLGDLA